MNLFTAVRIRVDLGIPDEALLGVILAGAAPFVGMWLYVRISRLLPDETETVGPHVVVRTKKRSDLGVHTYYRCKYCEKEFERQFFFRGEDCEEFRSGK